MLVILLVKLNLEANREDSWILLALLLLYIGCGIFWNHYIINLFSYTIESITEYKIDSALTNVIDNIEFCSFIDMLNSRKGNRVLILISGSRFGGSLGLLYCFGQAVGCALNVLGMILTNGLSSIRTGDLLSLVFLCIMFRESAFSISKFGRKTESWNYLYELEKFRCIKLNFMKEKLKMTSKPVQISTGFGESMAGLVGLEGNKWMIRTFAAGAVLLLGVINVAGVKWVIKLQFLLLLVLLSAGLDFMVGSFIGEDRGNTFYNHAKCKCVGVKRNFSSSPLR